MNRLDELTQNEEAFFKLIDLCNDMLNANPSYSWSWGEQQIESFLVSIEAREPEETE
jgi:hypothetical protein